MATLTEEFPPICIGCDIGQLHDYSAAVVAEVSQKDTGKVRFGPSPLPARYENGRWLPAQDIESVMETHYTVRHIERLPLGTSYPDVALHIADMLCSPLFVHRQVRCLIDVSGVGRAIYDDIRREISLRPEARAVLLKPITFASGQKYNRATGTLGKEYLVSRLQSLLQRGVVHAPDTAEVRALLEELRVYEIRIDQDGHFSAGAFKTGTHDDLATSLGLAALEDPWADRVTYSRRLW